MFICYVKDGEKRYNKFSHPTLTIDVQLFLPKHATGVKVGRRVDSERVTSLLANHPLASESEMCVNVHMIRVEVRR